MEPSSSAERQTSAAHSPSDAATAEEKLICLGSWLERTTSKETQAAQACSILPATTLTIGTAFAGAFVGIDYRWSAFSIFSVFVIGALGLFLYHYRRWTIWKAVAVRLQAEQRLMIGTNRGSVMAKTGQHPPDKLAQWFDKNEPVQFLSGPALALYVASILLGIVLFVFAIGKDYDLLQPKQAAAETPALQTAPASIGRPTL